MPYLQALNLQRSEVTQARDRLLAWDGQQDMDSAEAAYFEAFHIHLVPAIFEDELGDMAPQADGSTSRKQVEQLLPNAGNHWWDNVYTPQTETRDDILILALNDAFDFMEARMGDYDRWRWGALHTATFRNDTLGNSGISLIESIFNRGAYETAGTNIAINATGYSGADEAPFDVDWIPSQRMIVDMSNLDHSLTINTTGQSGHPYNQHYNDQIDRWRLIEYAPMHWDRQQLESTAEGILTLRPDSVPE
jgi:penicillin amidase